MCPQWKVLCLISNIFLVGEYPSEKMLALYNKHKLTGTGSRELAVSHKPTLASQPRARLPPKQQVCGTRPCVWISAHPLRQS